MSDRIPIDPSPVPPLPEDTTARVVGLILKAKPKVAVGTVSPSGMVKFTLFYRPLKITSQSISNMSLLHRSLLGDFLGKFLILTNLDVFMPLLTECDYAYFVRKYPLQRIWLRFDSDRLVFDCNIAVMYRLLNENLAKTLEGEQATVKWNWDFLKRYPKNPAH